MERERERMEYRKLTEPKKFAPEKKNPKIKTKFRVTAA